MRWVFLVLVALCAVVRADLCDPSPCTNGTCIVADDTTRCVCNWGWQGKLCSVARCDEKFVFDPESELCVCAEPYMGSACDVCRPLDHEVRVCVSVLGMQPYPAVVSQEAALVLLTHNMSGIEAFMPDTEFDGVPYDCACKAGVDSARSAGVTFGAREAVEMMARTIDATTDVGKTRSWGGIAIVTLGVYGTILYAVSGTVAVIAMMKVKFRT